MSEANTPAAILNDLQSQAQRFETPCGDGRMIWHCWGAANPVVVLFHGGAGSWRHWIKTIPALMDKWRVLIPDLPGLGESDLPPESDDGMAIARIVTDGIAAIIGPTTPYDVVGFFFGGTMASCAGVLCPDLVRSVTIIASAGVGGPDALGTPVRLEKVRHLEGEARRDTHRINLGRLMIADPAKIDDLALEIQDWGTVRSRLNTPAISRGGTIAAAIDALTMPLNGMWGEFDAPASVMGPARAAALKRRKPNADIRIVPGAGHWAAYEAPDFVNPTLLEMLARTRPAGA